MVLFLQLPFPFKFQDDQLVKGTWWKRQPWNVDRRPRFYWRFLLVDVDHWPFQMVDVDHPDVFLLVDVDHWPFRFSTGRRRPLSFSTGRHRPDWAFPTSRRRPLTFSTRRRCRRPFGLTFSSRPVKASSKPLQRWHPNQADCTLERLFWGFCL